jgi:hypothetical protein
VKGELATTRFKVCRVKQSTRMTSKSAEDDDAGHGERSADDGG